MTCPYCAEAIADDSVFCPKCGSRLDLAPPLPPVIPGPPGPYGEPRSSGKAIGSFISGIFFFFFPASIAAIILGHLSLSEIRKSGGRLRGRGFAITGLVLGYLGASIIPIMIVAAIAIPNLIRARMASNEASAVGDLRSYSFALGTYASNCPNIGFPQSLENLGPAPGHTREHCTHEGVLDGILGRAYPARSGYRFEYAPGAPNNLGQVSRFSLAAIPIQANKTGVRSFFVDQTGVIRVSRTGSADADSPPL